MENLNIWLISLIKTNIMSILNRKNLIAILNNEIVQYVLYSPFLDYHQWSTLQFVKINSKTIKPNEKIIDVGAGELRYKSYFKHCKYVSQDLGIGDSKWYFDNIDIKSTIYKIPVKRCTFDNILCTQVLEHLEFPDLAFKEFSRILKPGGKIFMTVPLGQGEHQIPYDYYRYTRYSLKNLGKRNHLNLIKIIPQGGIFINLEYMLWQGLGLFIPFKKNYTVRYVLFFLLLPIKFISGLFFVTVDLFDNEKTYTNNYNCIYEKVV